MISYSSVAALLDQARFFVFDGRVAVGSWPPAVMMPLLWYGFGT